MGKEALEKKLAEVNAQEQTARYNVHRLQGAQAVLLQLLQEEPDQKPEGAEGPQPQVERANDE